MSILIDDLTAEIDGARILTGITCELPEQAVTGILGPNGAGKSTLLRLIAGIRSPAAGRVLLDDTPVHELRRHDAAKRIALLEQSASLANDLTVMDVVLLGRIPHRRGLLGGFDTPEDRSLALNALRTVDATDFANRSWHSLSGGERQRVHIARALAQEPAVLLLDEPTNHLDVSAQLALLAQVRRLGLTSVVALHDLNLAAAYCDRIVLLAGGRLVAAGAPEHVLTPETIEQVYGAECDVIPHPRHGHPLVVYAMDGAVPSASAPVAREAAPAATPAA